MANNDNHTQQIDDLSPEIPEVQGELPSDMPESDIDEDYSPVTPELKIDSLKGNSRDQISETFIGSEIGSSDLSTKECSETMSSSSSSSDAESGTYNLPPKNYLLQHENDDEVMKPKILNVDEKENLHLGNEVVLKKKKGLEYEELLERVASYEVELKLAKKKLQSKQDEIAQLKYENLTLVEELGKTIENLRSSEDNMAKMEEKFRSELHETRHQLVSELDSERKLVSELQGMLVKTTNDLCEYGREIEELKHALHDAQEDFSKNRSKFESETAHLHEQRNALDARVKEAELRNKFLEEEIEKYEMENAEIKGFHESQEMGFLDEIRKLKEDLWQRYKIAESLNQSLDGCRLMHDILRSEKDEVFAKMQTLEAEVKHRDTNIEQMEEHIWKLTAENEEMLSELKKAQKIAEELKAEIEDQEREMEKQRVIISERADEKREAIKQLCFSLEYYRNEYQELCQAIIKHKRPAVLAS